MVYEMKRKEGTEELHIFKRADFILIGALVLFSFAFSLFLIRGGNEGHTVVVTVDGEVQKEVPLDSEEQIFRIDTPNGYNMVHVKDGTVFVGMADCPDRLCVKQGRISRPGETIICLPHKLIVEVKE